MAGSQPFGLSFRLHEFRSVTPEMCSSLGLIIVSLSSPPDVSYVREIWRPPPTRNDNRSWFNPHLLHGYQYALLSFIRRIY